jgi:hypothetical protein
LCAQQSCDPGSGGAIRARGRVPCECNANLRTQLERIIGRAGLTPWPKLFQNLRSTRETELAESFPLKVVCEWIGNSPEVAVKHYLQVTDEHFERACSAPTGALHKAVQQMPVTPWLFAWCPSAITPRRASVVPIFPELRSYLDAAWEAAESGAVYCITRYRT